MADPACAGRSPEPAEAAPGGGRTRKEKRKDLKKLKRKQIRREAAIREREAEESRSNDPEEQLRIRLREEEEAVSAERERKAFEERERLWLEAAAARKAEEEAAAAARKAEEEFQREKNKQIQEENELEEGDEWEYTEEGPAEIIWQGNEIIVKKKRVRVAKRNTGQKPNNEDEDRPTSNPLPPQSTAFVSYKNGESAQEVLEGVAKQIPNFGTEQDKAHCPFHLKTAACRFGSRCSRVHFYPDKSCTLLIRNMYNGPGLAWEQDEGLEHTDEEIERCYEEFYEDVHTEFLKFGELVNFKVCKNGSYHLRGNVYVHYKSLESAILAYNAINGRFFAGKQIACEFVGLTRWKVAICGEYMKSRLRTCSHGSACNFIHCFRNPGGDYEWADWDNPPPKFWLKKMYVLFGPSVESVYDKQLNLEEPERLRDSSRKSTPANYRRQSRKSTHDEMDMHNSGSGGEDSCGRRDRRSTSLRREHSRKRRERRAHLDKHEHFEENRNSEDHDHNVKYYSIGNGHDSGEDSSMEQDRYLLRKRRRCEEKNIFERHKRKHDTEEDLPSRKKGEALLGEQAKSEKKRNRKSHERHGREHRSSEWISDDTGDNGERSNKNSSRYYDGTQDIDSQERCDGRYCSDDLDSDKDSRQNTSHHSRCPNERREFDRYKSRHHRDHVSHDYEWDGKEAKSRKRESADRRFSSDESGDGRKREHHRSGRKGKHRRRREHNEGKDQSSNSDSDKLESDRRRYKKHSGSRTPVSCSGNPRREVTEAVRNHEASII